MTARIPHRPTRIPSPRRATLAALLGSVALVAAGCDTAQEGAVSGAGAGALAGLLVGSTQGEAGTGAAIGAGLGALSGAVIGDQNRRAEERARIRSHHHGYSGSSGHKGRSGGGLYDESW